MTGLVRACASVWLLFARMNAVRAPPVRDARWPPCRRVWHDRRWGDWVEPGGDRPATRVGGRGARAAPRSRRRPAPRGRVRAAAIVVPRWSVPGAGCCAGHPHRRCGGRWRCAGRRRFAGRGDSEHERSVDGMPIRRVDRGIGHGIRAIPAGGDGDDHDGAVHQGGAADERTIGAVHLSRATRVDGLVEDEPDRRRTRRDRAAASGVLFHERDVGKRGGLDAKRDRQGDETDQGSTLHRGHLRLLPDPRVRPTTSAATASTRAVPSLGSDAAGRAGNSISPAAFGSSKRPGPDSNLSSTARSSILRLKRKV